MKLSLRFIVPLIFVLSLVTFASVGLVNSLTLRWFTRDLDVRAQLIASTIQDSLIIGLQEKTPEKVRHLFKNVAQNERVFALGLCDAEQKMFARSDSFPSEVDCTSSQLPAVGETMRADLREKSLHLAVIPVLENGKDLGHLILLHDMSFVTERSASTRKYVVLFFIILAIVISLITIIVLQLSWRGWITGMRAVLKGEGLFKPVSEMNSQRDLLPFVKDLRGLVRELSTDLKNRDELQGSWTPATLKNILKQELTGDEILIVSNREPYIHQRVDGEIKVQVPASGLVTALEPIMRACSGTWIAHGSGDADAEVVDRHDRVKVPPGKPEYQIRRVWLSEEEEAGYYYGFSNEGLWPLCHIAHTRPIFRTEDWNQYKAVNEKFAKAVIDEAKTKDPVVLVQDYHFALLPKLIRDKLPGATVIMFWHIPWPNPEAFGICPWREEIIEGMLGSSILGFHTQFHCNNFIETVDRMLEARIDRETSTISHHGKLTSVKSYPISIAWPSHFVESSIEVAEARKKIRKDLGINPERLLAIGVDRLDYTKGILERFNAVERLFELHPEWIGKFSLVQIAAPSRSGIDHYQNFETHVRTLARKINHRFQKSGYTPIILKIEHHGPESVYEHFRGSEVCFVSSLHDGMNLVAKEFISSRTDEQGVLILSEFTGAARELPEALIVNPYDVDQCAEALHQALTMPRLEQQERMRSMRSLVKEFNVFRWAGRMLLDAARMRKRMQFLKRIKQ